MTLIDQRILIPAPMQAVWAVLANHNLLPQWRMDVRSVSVLTTEHNRQGTRRRISTKSGRKDIIEEILVWYEGVGYEYTLLDSTDYRLYKARIRLQGTVDGTIVQWTISYEIGGFLRRLFSGRRRRKSLENLSANSLRQLRRYLDSTGAKLDQSYRDKNSIRQAPDASSRAEYGAKLLAQEQAKQDSQKMQALSIEEPPVKIEDTPSVPQVMPPSFLSEALQSSEIDVTTGSLKIPDAPTAEDDTRPSPTVNPAQQASPARQALTDEDAAAAIDLKGLPDAAEADTPANPSVRAITPPASENKEAAAPSMLPTRTSNTTETTDESEEDENRPAQTAMRDTGEISIWEAFGVKRPSEALSTIIDELGQEAAEDAEDSPSSEKQVSASASEAKEEQSTTPQQPETPAPPSIETSPSQEDENTNKTIGDKTSLEKDTEAPKAAQSHESEASPSTEATTKQSVKPKTNLEEWLAANEPPIPESSTGTMKTVVQIHRKPKIGLRRLQRQRQQAVRRPKKDDDEAAPQKDPKEE